MNHSNINKLQLISTKLIKQSLSLNNDQKNQYLNILPKLNPIQLKEIIDLFQEEKKQINKSKLKFRKQKILLFQEHLKNSTSIISEIKNDLFRLNEKKSNIEEKKALQKLEKEIEII